MPDTGTTVLAQGAASVAVSVEERWEAVKAALRREAGETNFRSWIAPVSALDFRGGVLELGAPTRFVRDWVRTHYADRIRALWTQKFGALARVECMIAGGAASLAAEPAAPAVANDAAPVAAEGFSSPLDGRYTFETFVTGPSNAMAAGAARKVAEGAASFNPLYIHGGVGMGKTHLLHATAAAIRARRPGARVIYMSAERFMFLFVQALRRKDTMEFKAQLRAADVLLLDDLQFICGKEATQDEFLAALDALLAGGRQAVVAADRAPAELDGVGERLRSRLSGGLVTRIEAADRDLRLTVLKSKAALMGRGVPEDVLEFLADRITSNLRELEGALNRLVAHAELAGRAVTVETAEELLRDILRVADRSVTPEDIQKAVVAHYGIRMSDLLSPRRARDVARPRQVAMYLCKAMTPHSLPDLGRRFGGRDHTTIIHGVRKIGELVARDAEIARDIEALRKALAG